MSQEIDDLIAGEQQGLIGHHRLATMGANTDANAHPFTFDHITGVHNGVLGESNCRNLPTTSTHPVDSARLFNSIAKSGTDTSLNSIHGDWALIWYDSDKKKFYFIRNNGRPLWYRFSGSKRVLWVMSEQDMGEWILNRSSCTLHEDGWQTFEVDQLYSLDCNSPGELSLVKEREVKGKEYVPFVPTIVSRNDHYRSFQEYLEKRNNKSLPFGQTQIIGPVTQPTLVKTSGSIGAIKLHSFNELQEMSSGNLEELRDRSMLKRDQLISNNSLDYITLAQQNWSERITWRKQHTKSMSNLVNTMEEQQFQIKRLITYISIIKGRLDTRRVITAAHSGLTRPVLPEVKLSSLVEVNVRKVGTTNILERHTLFTGSATSEQQWLENHTGALKTHESFIGEDEYLSLDNDLEGAIEFVWTEKMNLVIIPSEHLNRCRKLTDMLEHFVGPKLKTWDKNYQRGDKINNFWSSTRITPNGMVWKAPSSKWLEHQLSIKVIYRFIRQAIEFAFDDNKYIHPAVIAEVRSNLIDATKLKEAA
jgi:hypothetical protein